MSSSSSTGPTAGTPHTSPSSVTASTQATQTFSAHPNIARRGEVPPPKPPVPAATTTTTTTTSAATARRAAARTAGTGTASGARALAAARLASASAAPTPSRPNAQDERAGTTTTTTARPQPLSHHDNDDAGSASTRDAESRHIGGESTLLYANGGGSGAPQSNHRFEAPYGVTTLPAEELEQYEFYGNGASNDRKRTRDSLRETAAMPIIHGPAWITKSVVAKVKSMRDPMIAFAHLVAGNLNGDIDEFVQDIDVGLTRLLARSGTTLDDLVERATRNAEKRARPTTAARMPWETRVPEDAQATTTTTTTSRPESPPLTPPRSDTVTRPMPAFDSPSADSATPARRGAGATTTTASSPGPSPSSQGETRTRILGVSLLPQSTTTTAAATSSSAASSTAPRNVLSDETATPSESRTAVMTLALFEAGILTPEIVEGARAVERANAERTVAAMQWLQMPEKLGHVFFTDVLASGFAASYSDVTEPLLGARADLTFYDLITRSDLRVRFAQLVACNVTLSRFRNQRRYMHVTTRDQAVTERSNLVRWFRTSSQRPAIVGGTLRAVAQPQKMYGGVSRANLGSYSMLYDDDE